MSVKQNKIQAAAANRTGSCRLANGEQGCQGDPAMLGWYFAQPAVQGRTYLLTMHGYVLV